MTSQLSTVWAPPGSQAKKHTQRANTCPLQTNLYHLSWSRGWRASHRRCSLCLHVPAAHQPLSITCTWFSPTDLTHLSQGAATLLKFVPMADKMKHRRAGKDPKLASQVTQETNHSPCWNLVLALLPAVRSTGLPFQKATKTGKVKTDMHQL